MATVSALGIPGMIVDDGAFFIFTLQNEEGSLSSGASTWVETIKYCYRNNKLMECWFDDVVTNTYASTNGAVYDLTPIYALADYGG
jgi:hypothetical protein